MAAKAVETADSKLSCSFTGRLTLIVVGLVVIVVIMFLAIGAPAVNSKADRLPLAVSGPSAAVMNVTTTLQQRQPGEFAPTTYTSLEQVRAAVLDREAVGGLALGSNGIIVFTAAGAGSPYPQALKAVGSSFADQGQKVSYDEVAPLTDDDPAAGGLTAMVLPLIFGGMISAVVLSLALRTRNPGWRLVTAIPFAGVAGLAVAAVLQIGFGTVNGSYWATGGSVTLGISAISLTALGLESLLGFAGLGVVAAGMLFVANPLSGIATGPQWLPRPWGAFGQWLPVGATGTAVRSVAYFGGHGADQAYLALALWVALGLVLLAVAALRFHRLPRI